MLEFVLPFAIFFLYVWWKWGITSRDEDAPPVWDGALPFIGHIHRFMGSGEGLYETCMLLSEDCTRKGGVMSIYTNSKIYYAITDPDDALTASNAAVDKHFFFDFLKPWLGNGIITASGSLWRQHRKLLNLAFRSQVLNGYVDTFNSQARKFVEKLSDREGKEPFDVSHDLFATFLETIFLTSFPVKVFEGTKFLKPYEYMDAVHEMFGIATRRLQNVWLRSEFLMKLFGLKKRQDDIVKKLKQMSETIIQKSKAEMTHKNNSPDQIYDEEHPNLLEYLMQLSKKNLYNDQEMRDEIDNMVLAGSDTTSSALLYIFVVLGSNQKVQDRVYEEYQEVLGGSDRDLNKDDFSKLVYTEAVIKETLRVFDIGPCVLRNVDTDIKLKNCTLKAGNYCLILFCGINRHSVWGDDANEFRPERWLNTAFLPESHSTFAAFGVGKRACLGKTYAMMSMYPLLGHFLRRYRVISDWTKLKNKVDFLMKPISGHYISLEPRVQ